MRKPPQHAAWAVILVALVGCDRSAAVIVPPPPHGGVIAVLPGDLGKVEIVREPLTDKPGQMRLVLYFLGPDSQPIKTPPTSATLTPQSRGVAAVKFSPTSATDPAQAGTLESPALDISSDISGGLTTTLDGKSVDVTINAR